MPYHPQTNGLVERLHQTIMHMIGKLGEDKKADWPSYLAEIAHTYNANQSAVTGYSPHYLMFVLPNESVCIKCRLRMDLCWTYEDVIMPFVLSLNDFCHCIFVFVLCINYNIFHPLWDQYTDSIVPLAYVPVWCCACYFVGFDLSVNNLSVHFVVSYANHLTFGSI